MSIESLISSNDRHFIDILARDRLVNLVERMVSRTQNAAVVIGSDGSLAGIITDHDVMRALAGNNGQLGDETVSDWMTDQVITCPTDTKLSEALKLMGRHRIRHLVVVDDGKPVGLVGIRDALSKIHEHDEIEINVLRDMAAAHGSR